MPILDATLLDADPAGCELLRAISQRRGWAPLGGTYIHDRHGSEYADDAAEDETGPVPSTEAYLCP
jgi:hypothetical protein